VQIEIDTNEAAEIANVDERTIQRWFKNGQIKGHFVAGQRAGKGGQKLMIEKESLLQYIAQGSKFKAESKIENPGTVPNLPLKQGDSPHSTNLAPLNSVNRDSPQGQSLRYKIHRGEPGCRVVTQFQNGIPVLNDDPSTGSGRSGTMNDEKTEHPPTGGDPVTVGRLVVPNRESPPLQNLPVILKQENMETTGTVPNLLLPAVASNWGQSLRQSPKCSRIANLRFALIQKFNEELTKPDPNLPLFKNGNGHSSKTKRIQRLLDLYNSGILLPEIYKEFGPRKRATLYNWLAAEAQDGVNGLIPQHGRAGISKITEHEKNLVLTLLLHQNRLKTAYAITLAKEYLKKKNYESPSSPATLRRFADQFKKEHYDLWTLRREGEKALNDKVSPYAERDPNLLEVGEGLVGDGTRLNFLQVIHPITGKPCRAALVLFWDWRSSYPLGWEIMVEENIQCVTSALRNAILALGKIPKWIYLDNGKAFKSKIFTEDIDFEDGELPGMFARLNINYHFAQPYNAQSKPIERIFGILNEQLERLIPSYTGASIEDKPAWTKRNEKLARAAHDPYIPTVQETNDLIRAWRDHYADRPSRGRNGLRPIDIFNEGKGPGVDPNELIYLMMDRKIKDVHRNGITWLGWHWFNEAMYGLKDKVVMKYSLCDLSQVAIFHKNEFLCWAKPIEPVHPMASESENPKDMEAVKEVFRLKKRVKNMTRNLSDLLETKAASQIDWSRTRTPQIAETIERIEAAKKPKVINISEFAASLEPEMPVEEEVKELRFGEAFDRFEYHKKGGVFLGPELDNEFIRKYKIGEIAPGEYEAIYGSKENKNDDPE
jgi:putative transposase